LSLGKVVTDRKKFHAKRYIWPVGFKSTRQYPSMADPTVRVLYTSEIVDGGDEPKFNVTPEGGETIQATTPSGAWTEVVKRVNDMKLEKTGKRLFTTVSGPEMFGFSHPTIAKLIQELPGAELCDRYVCLSFEEKNPSARKRRKSNNDIILVNPTINLELEDGVNNGDQGGGDGEDDFEEIEEEAGTLGNGDREEEEAIESGSIESGNMQQDQRANYNSGRNSPLVPRVQFARPSNW